MIGDLDETLPYVFRSGRPHTYSRTGREQFELLLFLLSGEASLRFCLYVILIFYSWLLPFYFASRNSYPVPRTNMCPKVENSVTIEVGRSCSDETWVSSLGRSPLWLSTVCSPPRIRCCEDTQPSPHAQRLLFSTLPWLLYLDLKALALRSPKWSSWNMKLIWGHSS